MFEINPEPWEKVPENFEKLAPLIKTICYPPMPEKQEEREVGKYYRLYPEGFFSGNNTAYHGGVRLGSDAKKLLIFFNGGGVSFDEYTCARPSNAFTFHIQDTYYSNDGEWIGDYFLREGMSVKREDNPFTEWSSIHALYCNGDFHCGDGEFPYAAQDGSARIMNYHGYRNVMALIDAAKAYLPEPEEILVAGSSAGGFGTALLMEDIIEKFPNCSKFTCLVDSALLYSDHWTQIMRNIWHTPEHIASRITGDNLVMDCLSHLHKKHGNLVQILFMCSEKDALLTVAQNALDRKGQIHTKADGMKFRRQLTEMVRELRLRIPDIGLYIFTAPMDAPGYDEDGLTLHCALNNAAFLNHKEEDVTPCEWLKAAVCGDVKQIGMGLLKGETAE